MTEQFVSTRLTKTDRKKKQWQETISEWNAATRDVDVTPTEAKVALEEFFEEKARSGEEKPVPVFVRDVMAGDKWPLPESFAPSCFADLVEYFEEEQYGKGFWALNSSWGVALQRARRTKRPRK